MTAKIRADGTFDFGSAGKGLLSISDITLHAVRLFAEQHEKLVAMEHHKRIRDLRTSCGAENPPIRIMMPEKFDG